jgi:transposase-like protein
MAVERLNGCEDISKLAKELGVHRRLLYTWRDKLEAMEATKEQAPAVSNTREAALRKEVGQLKRVLAEKTLEVDFFRGALQSIEAREQKDLARGHLRPNPGSDVDARRIKY